MEQTKEALRHQQRMAVLRGLTGLSDLRSAELYYALAAHGGTLSKDELNKILINANLPIAATDAEAEDILRVSRIPLSVRKFHASVVAQLLADAKCASLAELVHSQQLNWGDLETLISQRCKTAKRDC
jgi:hypothetical protein